MTQLLANRFVHHDGAWIDLATGNDVRVVILPAGTRAAQMVWSDWCATLSLMRHPLLNELLDYGAADPSHTFEAYARRPPIAARGSTGTALLKHAVRFLEAHGITLSPERATAVLRPIVDSGRSHRARPIGIVLQRRDALWALQEVLDHGGHPGCAAVTVSGACGLGLRTLRLQFARWARVHGYVPIDAHVLAAGQVFKQQVQRRHLCVLVEQPEASTSSLGRAVTRLGIESTRRHLLVSFDRRTEKHGLIRLAPMGVAAMMTMVFGDREMGPDECEVVTAVGRAGGSPGRLIAELGAAPIGDAPQRIFLVRETAPAYISTPSSASPPRRPAGRTIASAGDRAAKMAARGRHASATRLLARAARVLERRGDPALAARCLEQLGWLLRARGRLDAALDRFEKARQIASGTGEAVSAAIAIGVARTDHCQFEQAEAILRSALAAADLVGETTGSEVAAKAQNRARLALARCLHWEGKNDDALALLGHEARGAPSEIVQVGAMRGRILLALGDSRTAATAADQASAAARVSEPWCVVVSSRAVGMVRAATGDRSGARDAWLEGVAAASQAHLPLAALRMRALLLQFGLLEPLQRSRVHGLLRGALERGTIPPLLQRQLAAALPPPDAPSALGGLQLARPAVASMQRMLDLVFSARTDHAALDAVVQFLCDELHAVTAQICTPAPARRILARAGRPWAGDFRTAERALALGWQHVAFASDPPAEAAYAITLGSQVIAVLMCRWTAATPVHQETASSMLRNASLAVSAPVRGLLERPEPPPPDPAWREFVGASSEAAALREAIQCAARAPYPVLIEGESGSGKELVARAVHRLSARRDRKFCAVNCAALADDLLEAELFGHARGAFTGAVTERPGLFEEADNGSLFLDEVGELSPRAQAKLLRVLQDGEVRRVGENFARRVDARVIAATNRKLDEEVEAGRFRADLHFRLDVVRIRVPALRDRVADIPLLAAHFWEDATKRLESRATLGPETVTALTRYEWPGNIRQLQNVLASLAVHAPRRGRVPASLLPAQIARTAKAGPQTFDDARAEFERRFIAAELARAGGQRARAARALGVTRQGLAKMMKRLKLDTAGSR
jgi:DNA-binding NtrC family response regulator/tetratricopeptide (TPR) repeat protein